MNRELIRSAILRTLGGIAPEADLSALEGNADLRETLDIDSMDFLRFAIDLHKELSVDIPERDYAKVRTLDACVSYVASKLSRPAETAKPSA